MVGEQKFGTSSKKCDCVLLAHLSVSITGPPIVPTSYWLEFRKEIHCQPYGIPDEFNVTLAGNTLNLEFKRWIYCYNCIEGTGGGPTDDMASPDRKCGDHEVLCTNSFATPGKIPPIILGPLQNMWKWRKNKKELKFITEDLLHWLQYAHGGLGTTGFEGCGLDRQNPRKACESPDIQGFCNNTVISKRKIGSSGGTQEESNNDEDKKVCYKHETRCVVSLQRAGPADGLCDYNINLSKVEKVEIIKEVCSTGGEVKSWVCPESGPTSRIVDKDNQPINAAKLKKFCEGPSLPGAGAFTFKCITTEIKCGVPPYVGDGKSNSLDFNCGPANNIPFSSRNLDVGTAVEKCFCAQDWSSDGDTDAQCKLICDLANLTDDNPPEGHGTVWPLYGNPSVGGISIGNKQDCILECEGVPGLLGLTKWLCIEECEDRLSDQLLDVLDAWAKDCGGTGAATGGGGTGPTGTNGDGEGGKNCYRFKRFALKLSLTVKSGSTDIIGSGGGIKKSGGECAEEVPWECDNRKLKVGEHRKKIKMKLVVGGMEKEDKDEETCEPCDETTDMFSGGEGIGDLFRSLGDEGLELLRDFMDGICTPADPGTPKGAGGPPDDVMGSKLEFDVDTLCYDKFIANGCRKSIGPGDTKNSCKIERTTRFGEGYGDSGPNDDIIPDLLSMLTKYQNSIDKDLICDMWGFFRSCLFQDGGDGDAIPGMADRFADCVDENMTGENVAAIIAKSWIPPPFPPDGLNPFDKKDAMIILTEIITDTYKCLGCPEFF